MVLGGTSWVLSRQISHLVHLPCWSALGRSLLREKRFKRENRGVFVSSLPTLGLSAAEVQMLNELDLQNPLIVSPYSTI